MRTETDLQLAASNLNAELVNQLGDKTIDIALVLGSGLGGLGGLIANSAIETILERAYKDIPGMPESSAPTHDGLLKIIKTESQHLLIFQGRFHLYEGHSARDAAATSYLSHLLGAKQIIFTNAAGGLNPELTPGDIMLVNDHINFTGQSPLIGHNDAGLGVRFPDMSRAYNQTLQTHAISTAANLNIPLAQGIYAGVTGPELETSAERRHMRAAGCDAIGMSLVMETIGAVHCGLEVMALSAITNVATGAPDQPADTIETVLANAALAAKKLEHLLPSIIQGLAAKK